MSAAANNSSGVANSPMIRDARAAAQSEIERLLIDDRTGTNIAPPSGMGPMGSNQIDSYHNSNNQ